MSTHIHIHVSVLPCAALRPAAGASYDSSQAPAGTCGARRRAWQRPACASTNMPVDMSIDMAIEFFFRSSSFCVCDRTSGRSSADNLMQNLPGTNSWQGRIFPSKCYTHVGTHFSRNVGTRVHTHDDTHVNTNLDEYICKYACTHVYTCVHVCVRIRTSIVLTIHMPTYLRLNTCLYTCL